MKAASKTLSITLTLDQKEAEALLAVCGMIGGDRQASRRRVFDELDTTLRDVGIVVPETSDDRLTVAGGGIYFHMNR